jgi:hypothetical protein
MPRTVTLLLSTLTAVLMLGVPAAHAAKTQRAVVSWSAAADVDLHVYDERGHHAFHGAERAIPAAVLSADSLSSGSESFTDRPHPSIRPFGYEVCLVGGQPTDVVVDATWIDEAGGSHEQRFTLASPGDCKGFGAVALITRDTDHDAVVDPSDNCPDAANPDQADADGDGIGDACEAAPAPTLSPTLTPSSTPGAQPQIPGPEDTRPAPVLGKSVVARAVAGTIRVKRKGGRFHVLRTSESIPLGSTVDATKGKVQITAASGPGGATQSGRFSTGAFVVTQTRGAKPITRLALSGALQCGTTGAGTASASARRRRVRRLWGDGHGRFRTRGRHGAATVRGTKWLTEDRCDGTLVRVRRGVVLVRDFTRKKTVRVTQGGSYLARARKQR